MGLYKHLRNSWRSGSSQELVHSRLVEWRHQPSSIRIPRPTRLDRARSIGYRAKEGIIVVRQRVIRGGHTRPKIRKGRRPKHFRQNLVLAKNYQQIAEERASRKFPNLEVLNSYFVAEDGKYRWFEIIMLDPQEPAIRTDKTLAWIANPDHRGRAFRGLTSAGRKSRDLRHKGIGAEKARPSHRAKGRQMN